MSEENTPQETQEVAEGQVQETTTDATEGTVEDSQVETPDTEVDDVEVKREREARKKANREAQNLRERLRAYEEAEEQRKQEAMSELEKASAHAEKLAKELAEEREGRTAVTQELSALRVRTEATSKALAAGAKQERLDAVLRLSDLSNATDEDGAPDPKAIEAAIKATLKDYPEFKSGSKDIGGPSNPASEPASGKKDPWNMSSEEFEELTKRVSFGERVVPS